MQHADLPEALDRQIRYLNGAIRRFVWRARGSPGQREREMSLRAYDEGRFSSSAAYLKTALLKSGGDDALRLDVARWARYGMVNFADAKLMFSAVVSRGVPKLARQAASELIDLVWEREGADAAEKLLSDVERWLGNSVSRKIRIAALLNEAGKSDQALSILRYLARSNPEVLAKIGYLDLVLMADRAGLGPLPQADLAQRMASRLEAGEKRLDELLATGEGVAVVANGTTLQGKGLGPLIDEHRLVMRFNNHEGSNDALNQGMRTDIWVRPLSLKHVPWKPLPDPSLIIFNGSNLRNRFSTTIWRFESFPETTSDISVFPTSLYLDLFRKLEASPSSGLLGLALVANKSEGELPTSQVFGYSLHENTESTSYYHGKEVSGSTPSRHNWMAEQGVFVSLLRG